MLKKWYYWKRYHPRYTFKNMNSVVINETTPAFDGFNNDPVYQISIEMCLSIYNNDDLNTLFLDCAQGKMSLRIYSKTEKRARYTLYFSAASATHKVVALREKTISFVLMSNLIDMKPRLGNEAHCDRISIGVAQLDRMNYKLKGKPFDVEVDWSKVNLGETK